VIRHEAQVHLAAARPRAWDTTANTDALDDDARLPAISRTPREPNPFWKRMDLALTTQTRKSSTCTSAGDGAGAELL
jgi:hypothetical protein